MTNTELHGDRVVATSFQVSIDGVVNKTQRMLVKIKDRTGLRWYEYGVHMMIIVLLAG